MSKFIVDRRQILKTVPAAAASAILPNFLAGQAYAQELTKMTYLTPFGYLISFAETMYADTGGFFKKHGLDVTIEGGRGSSMAVQQVTAGNVLVSRTGGTDLIKAYAKDPSIVAVAEIFQRDLFYVISSKDAPIEKPADMAGKTIGIVSAGGATENILDMMLAATDTPKDQVARDVVGNAPAAFQLIKQGRIAAFIATSDTVFQLHVDKQPVVAWSTDDVALSPGQVYMTSKAQLEAQKKTIAAFLAAVYDCLGVLLATKDLKPVVESMSAKYDIFESKRPDGGLSVLKQGIQNYKSAYDAKFASSKEKWENTYNLMLKAGLVDKIDDHNFFDDSARALAFS